MNQSTSKKYQITANYKISFKQKVLEWLKTFNTFCFMDSNNYQQHTTFDFLAGVEVYRSCTINSENELAALDIFLKDNSWYFGHLSYEAITNGWANTQPESDIGFPQMFFYQPKIVLSFKDNILEIFAQNPDTIFDEIAKINLKSIDNSAVSEVITVRANFNQKEYISIIEQLQKHIKRGDCYEINFCQKYFIENYNADIWQLYNDLTQVSPNPQSCLYKVNDAVLICASPERFIKKENRTIISQPIKGTLARNAMQDSSLEDERNQLYQSKKDRAENVMVVDLVRNDLSKVCKPGTVKVDELFGIYSFPQVHQMITTISGTLEDNVQFSQIFKALFPMGSMTGAPKRSVMELIHQYEPYARGLFSGTVGYIQPNGNFDFNVVIRSILYNTLSKYLAFYAGSGITAYSQAVYEWEECEVKAKAILQVLQKSTATN